ncbi:restriction endonuclease [Cyanobacterium aponinum UTEX 3222]|uniref:restriction endonuclease n=1 Tax=Cyanobacterium aponinum TaxID=379064 RepID=UPI000C12C2AE|nr:restriction endonuclease [Cyanobacterium aponinum]PHV62524.1 restriction endonuclease [Cyanobacterium aponinum IPPAS B-1201]WRL43044.1 restriction endonuclease [Cyanobacterium aponinum UTEX 3222]
MKNNITICDAILKVMYQCQIPLSPQEVYRQIVEQNLYEFHAQKPDHIVKGTIRRHCQDLNFPSAREPKYFGMTDDGKFYALENNSKNQLYEKTNKEQINTDKQKVKEIKDINETLNQIKQIHTTYRDLLKKHILSDLKNLAPVSFEIFAKNLLEVYGFEKIQVTSINNDGGIDGYGKLKVGLAYMKVAFQCKRWIKTSVGRVEIDKFRGAIQGDYEQGIFFTTSYFTEGAKKVSIKPGAVPVILIDGLSIVEMMIEKNFGVEIERLPLYTYALDEIIS